MLTGQRLGLEYDVAGLENALDKRFCNLVDVICLRC